MRRWGLAVALVFAGCSGDDVGDDTTNRDAGQTTCGAATMTSSRGRAPDDVASDGAFADNWIPR